MRLPTCPRPMPAAIMTVLILVALVSPAARPQGASPTGCTVCEDQHEVACPTCSGRGRETVSCFSCRGSGELACGVCSRLQGMEIPRLGDRKLAIGYLPCRNKHCQEGSVRWSSGEKNRCQVCGGKAVMSCPLCRAGKIKCWTCKGRKKLTSVCMLCAGTKRIPCPGCKVGPEGDRCVICNGKALRPCELCDARPAPKGACPDCRAEGWTICPDCLGTGGVTCDACGGAGRQRYVSEGGSGGGLRSCGACKKRGVVECLACTKGRLECRKCERGKVAGWCGSCPVRGKVLCEGCLIGTFRGRWVLGRVLREKGRHARALAFLEAALAHVKTRFGRDGPMLILGLGDADPEDARKVAIASIQKEVDEVKELVAAEKDPP